jgi:hypothetical protein
MENEILNSKKEASKRYNAKSYEKHKGEESQFCEVCYGRFQYYNKSHHNKSKRHLLALEQKNKVI